MKNLDNLRRIQRENATKVIVQDHFEFPPSIIAGVDLAFLREDGIAACTAMDFPPKQIVEAKQTVTHLTFPYLPTFLTFREGPPMLEVMSSMRSKIDVFLVNGQGIAHPLHCGLASHVGVVSSRPTIGVASSHLIGEYDNEPENEGEAVPLKHRGEIVGWVLRSRLGSKPIFVSPGHLVGLESSLRVVRDCLRGHRLPEPLQMAHIKANQKKRELEARANLG
ncbi:endonuclease V [Candidatus Bathyarchaeota archaeon]|nr:endonuclease V [Candidatus Bathyarchaeota archaeon]